MNAAILLRRARGSTGLTQSALAARSGTSQATLSAYEGGTKQPSAATLCRILAAAGWRLAIEPASAVIMPTRAQLDEVSRELGEVLGLAAALPTRHEPDLAYPRLDRVAA